MQFAHNARGLLQSHIECTRQTRQCNDRKKHIDSQPVTKIKEINDACKRHTHTSQNATKWYISSILSKFDISFYLFNIEVHKIYFGTIVAIVRKIEYFIQNIDIVHKVWPSQFPYTKIHKHTIYIEMIMSSGMKMYT